MMGRSAARGNAASRLLLYLLGVAVAPALADATIVNQANADYLRAPMPGGVPHFLE